jgi:hypothetical protein
MNTAIDRVRDLDLETFARSAGLHPDLVRRFVALGLLEASTRPDTSLLFSTSQLAVAARLQRLRSGFALNYAALGVVVDLLDRIAELEAALRRSAPSSGGSPWT